ncbi:MAG: D-2-hydroxyacid dehydrogenase [Acidobacteria bacterium]|nr:D-2-hydroxyacid dehydrogenase [Acidobacteriota bacterium]
MAARTVLFLNNPVASHLKLLARLPDETRIVVGERAEAFAEAAPDADILVIGAVPRALAEEVWTMAPRLQWVHSMAAGLDTVLFPALVASELPLTNSRAVFARSLGEFALAGMLWFAKGMDRMRRQQKAGVWQKFDVQELHGKVLGVVGHGSIGRAAASLAMDFGMDVLGVGHKHAREELEHLLRASDYLLAAAPLTEQTRGMLGETELRLMKPSAILLNLGRGPVIVEQALIRALNEGWIRGAVLDVYDVEPLPAGHPFWAMDNVFMSPHCADNTETWMEDAMELFLDNFARFDAGEQLRNVVDKEKGY